MNFQNADVAHLRAMALEIGYYNMSYALLVLGVPFEDTLKILLGVKPR